MPSTWTSKAMWRAVLYCAILNALANTASYHLWDEAFSDLWSNEFQVFSELDKPDPKALSGWRKQYFKELPQGIVLDLLLTPISYMWHIWLERLLPTRPRGVDESSTLRAQEKVPLATEGDDALEEEMMKRLIAKGKVRRASISWMNTFVKWIMTMVYVMVFLWPLASIIEAAIDFKGLAHVLGRLKEMKDVTMWFVIPVAYFFSARPFVTLLSFMLVPVQHRLPFQSALLLAFDVFVGAFLMVIVPWLRSKEFVQEIIRNATEAGRAAQNATLHGNSTNSVTLQIDEL